MDANIAFAKPLHLGLLLHVSLLNKQSSGIVSVTTSAIVPLYPQSDDDDSNGFQALSFHLMKSQLKVAGVYTHS
jgi:hypothetical protein